MGRAKLKMELIRSEKIRRQTFKKRKDSLMKKMRELMTLCDVSGCLIIYGSNQDKAEPEIWPRNLDEVHRVMEIYKAKNEGGYCSKTTYGLSEFFKESRSKIEEEVKNLRKKNAEAKYPTSTEFLNGQTEDQLREFAAMLGNKAEYAKSRIQMLRGNKELASGMNLDSDDHDQMMLRQNWHGFYPPTGLEIVNPIQNPILDHISQFLMRKEEASIMMNYNSDHDSMLMNCQGFYTPGFEITNPIQNPDYISDQQLRRKEEASSSGFNSLQMMNYNSYHDSMLMNCQGFYTPGFQITNPVQNPNQISYQLLRGQEEASTTGLNGLQMMNYNSDYDPLSSFSEDFFAPGFDDIVNPIQNPTGNPISAMNDVAFINSGVQNPTVDHQQQVQDYATIDYHLHQQVQHYATLDCHHHQVQNYGNQR